MGTRELLNDQQTHSPETQKVVRFVDYLTPLASLRAKLIRDIAEYEKVLWVSNVPHERGCFTQAWGRDEEHELRRLKPSIRGGYFLPGIWPRRSP